MPLLVVGVDTPFTIVPEIVNVFRLSMKIVHAKTGKCEMTVAHIAINLMQLIFRFIDRM